MNLAHKVAKRNFSIKKERSRESVRIPRKFIFKSVEAPLDLQFVDYLEAYPPNGKKSNEIIKQMKNYQESFRILHNDFDKDMKAENISLHTISKIVISEYLENKVIFALNKYKKISLKYHRSLHDYYANASTKLSQFENFLSQSIQNNSPYMIKYDKFLESLKSREETNKHVQLKFKMKSLENYCQLHKDDYRIPMIHTEELIQSLQSVSELVDIKKRYVPMSSFDDCLYCYCIRNNLILKFQQIVSKMPQYPTIISHNIFNEPKVSRASSVGTLLWAQAQTTRGKSSISNRTLPPKPNKDIENFDFENFDTFILTFFSILSDHFAENQSLFLILRCASIRILFDLYYTENENIFSVNENQEDFIKKCTDIIELTPKDLKVTEEIIGTDNYLKTFDEIFQEIKSFEIASQQIFMLQFYINPIDMGNAMFVAIENVENGIRKIHNDINFLEISFDDIFTLLIPVFAKSPITCTDSLDRVLKIFSQLKLSISLDYGIISVASVIDQIKKMNEAL